jgi:hypothetical protein
MKQCDAVTRYHAKRNMILEAFHHFYNACLKFQQAAKLLLKDTARLHVSSKDPWLETSVSDENGVCWKRWILLYRLDI